MIVATDQKMGIATPAAGRECGTDFLQHARKVPSEPLACHVQHDPSSAHEQVESAPVTVQLVRIRVPQPVILHRNLELGPRQIRVDRDLSDLDGKLRDGHGQIGQDESYAESRLRWRLRAAVRQLERVSRSHGASLSGSSHDVPSDRVPLDQALDQAQVEQVVDDRHRGDGPQPGGEVPHGSDRRRSGEATGLLKISGENLYPVHAHVPTAAEPHRVRDDHVHRIGELGRNGHAEQERGRGAGERDPVRQGERGSPAGQFVVAFQA